MKRSKARSDSDRRIAEFEFAIVQLHCNEAHKDLTLQEYRIALANLLQSSLTRMHKPKGKKTNGKT